MWNWLKTYWPAVALALAVLAVLDGTLSTLFTCHPVGAKPNSGASQQQAEEFCTALNGPFFTVLVWLAEITHKYEGLITAAFTVVLAVFTGRLWFSTEKLWEATKKLATDAETTAQNQANDTRILQRAYLAVEPGEISASNDAGKCHPNIVIRNAGNLPARQVKWVINWRVSQDHRLSELPIDAGTADGANTLPPGREMIQGGPIIYVGDEADELRNEIGLYLYVWGAVYYQDGFGADRISNFCFRYNTVNLEGAVKQQFIGGTVVTRTVGQMIASTAARVHRFGNDAT